MTQKHQFTFEERIAIDYETQQKLITEKIIYNKVCQKQQQWKNDKNQLDCYILSNEFIEQWKKFTLYNPTNLHLTQNKGMTPLRINEDIIDEILDFEEVFGQNVTENDFTMFSKEILPAFSMYHGKISYRKQYIDQNGEKKLQLHPKIIKIFFIDYTQVNKIRNQSKYQPPNYKCFLYQYETIKDLKNRLIKYVNSLSKPKLQNSFQAKIWLCDQKFVSQEHFNCFRVDKKAKTLKPPGVELNQKNKIKQFAEIQGRIFVLQLILQQKFVYCNNLDVSNSNEQISKSIQKKVVDYKKPSVIITSRDKDRWPQQMDRLSKSMKKCQFCKKDSTYLKQVCICKKVSYCSSQCKDKHLKQHRKTCQSFSQFQNLNVQEKLNFSLTSSSKRGIVGLQNLGNTCYMNSALQCLSNTTELTDYFLKNYYQKEININNPISSQGKVAYNYAKFLQTMWCGQFKVFSPISFKRAISIQFNIFQGNQQHDSQQFLSNLLDCLHEDLNRVIKKTLTQEINLKNKEEQVIAKESWINHLRRNQSIITDLMTGQLKSLIICPNCDFHSHTFDCFISLPIPVPDDQILEVTLYFFYHNFSSETKKYTVSSKKNSISELSDNLSKLTGISANNFKLFVTGFNGMVKQIQETDTVRKLIQQKNLNEGKQQKQLFCQQYSPQQMKKINKQFLIFKFVKANTYQTLTFKRIFPFILDGLEGRQIYDRICSFLAKAFLPNGIKTKYTQQQINKGYLTLRNQVGANKTINIFIKWGDMKVQKQMVSFKHRQLIEDQTKIGKIVIDNNLKVEFQIVLNYKGTIGFNSFTSHTERGQIRSTKVSTYKLEQCFKQFTMAEILMDGNQWYCPECKEFQKAQKQLQIYKTPKILIIQLKRFRNNGKAKNQSIIQFQQQLNLQKYLINRELPQAYFNEMSSPIIKPHYCQNSQTNKKSTSQYTLFATINHFGDIYGGHYIAHAFNNKDWYRFNDSSVEKVSSFDKVKDSAYILFYRRKF